MLTFYYKTVDLLTQYVLISDEVIAVTFGERLKQLRESRHISQQKLADSLGVSQSAVASWETDSREPNFAMIKRVASYFCVSFTSLMPTEESGNDLVLQVADSMHQNPKLRILFDRSRYLTESDLDAVLAVVSALQRERNADE